MAKRATIEDIATAAGVSVATVDRVLNRRRPVKRETATAVVTAAEALDYYATPLMRRRIDDLSREVTLGFVLQKQSKTFYTGLADALKNALERVDTVRGETVIRFVDELSASALVKAMTELGKRCDALGIVAVDHPHVSDAIEGLSQRGVPTVSLLSGLSAPALVGHVGLDGRKAGRSAAWAMKRLVRIDGSVAVLIGSHRYQGHEDREIGFRSYFREFGAPFDILEPVSYFDDDDGAYAAMGELVTSGRKISGCYVIGGGMGGVLRALQEQPLHPDAVLIGHELNAATRDGLLDGSVDMILSTPIDRVAGQAVERLVAAIDGRPLDGNRELLPFEICIAESL